MFSKVIRRTHMYLALFLAPWALMYALSTIAMNHRAYFQKKYGGNPVAWEKEREQTYPGAFPAGATARDIGRQILRDLQMDGAHSVNATPERITIQRHDPITPRRIIYHRDDRKVVVEKQVFRGAVFLEHMHRRRGFQQPYELDDAWALSVDVVIVAMLFWAASGVWMWLEMRKTRSWGAFSAAVGLALFGFFLLTI